MRFSIIIFIILSLTSAAFGQNLLTLDEAVRIALQTNSTLKQSENAISAYETGELAGYGGLMPTVGAQLGWNWSRVEAGETFIPGVGTFQQPAQEERSISAGIGADWLLFDGLSNFAALSQSQNELESAQLSLARLKQDIVFQTITYYYDVVNFQQLLKVKEEDVIYSQKNYETISERNKLGAVTLADVYASQVRLGNAELEVIRANNNLETAKTNLLYFLGLNVLEEYEFSDSLSTSEQAVLDQSLSKDFENIKSLVNDALQNRLDYASARFNLESAYNGVTIARSGHFPSLTGSASYSTSANVMKDLFEADRYFVGLNLNIPIFSGFSVVNRVQQAQVNAMTREIELSDLEREITRGIHKTFLDLQGAEKLLDVSQRNVTAAEENRKIEQEKYNLGAGTLLNVLVANSEYVTAQTNYINAQFAYVTLSEQLKYQLGVLDYKRY
jgi:outer membrane protein